MIATVLLKFACLISCATIVVRCEPVLNRMGRRTPLLAFGAFFLLTIGAAVQLGAMALGETPSVSAVITSAGVAALLICERRLRVFFRSNHHGRAS